MPGEGEVARREGQPPRPPRRAAKTVQSIVEELNVEAAYFYTDDGKRTALMVVDLQDASELPRIAEPWFLAFNASVEFKPTMILEDLERTGPSIDQAVEAFG